MKYNVLTDYSAQTWVVWCVREISTAFLVANLVLCFPLVRKVIPIFVRLFGMEKNPRSQSSVRSLAEMEESVGSQSSGDFRKREESDVSKTELEAIQNMK